MNKPLTIPPWMQRYLPHFVDTGGNPVETLINDKTPVQINAPLAFLAHGAYTQYVLLLRLYDAGLIEEAGWAEGVATPDENIGFVFTRLGPEETGLPVAITVGDDAPLAIVGEVDWAVMPAVRRWIVLNAATLSAYWRHKFSTFGLLDRLRKLPPK